jgi:hypothetical protein
VVTGRLGYESGWNLRVLSVDLMFLDWLILMVECMLIGEEKED